MSEPTKADILASMSQQVADLTAKLAAAEAGWAECERQYQDRVGGWLLGMDRAERYREALERIYSVGTGPSESAADIARQALQTTVSIPLPDGSDPIADGRAW